MVEANVSDLANKILGFEILHFQDIWKALNIAHKIDELREDAVDKKIQILRIVIAASKENTDLFWKKTHLQTFLDIMVFLSKKVWKDREYTINLQKLAENLQQIQIQEKFHTQWTKIQARVQKLLQSWSTLRTSQVMTHWRWIQS